MDEQIDGRDVRRRTGGWGQKGLIALSQQLKRSSESPVVTLVVAVIQNGI